MDIVTWGSQEFLNPTDSSDNGFFKMSTRPRDYADEFGFSAKTLIADCDGTITLDFGVYSYVNTTQEESTFERNAGRTRKLIAERREKIRMLLESLNGFAEALETNLCAVEAEIDRIEQERKTPLDRASDTMLG